MPGVLECPRPEAENPWRKAVRCVSFPRSGHHLLVSLMGEYFGPTFNYCEYYTGCRGWPCRRAGNNLQKNHDFQLNVTVPKDAHFIVQIRHPWPAIVSRFRLKLQERRVADTREDWERHRVTQMQKYVRFIDKWVLPESPTCLVLTYHELVWRPVEQLGRVVDLFEGSCDLDRCRLAVETTRVAERRSWRDFAHTTDEALQQVESINRLGLPLV